MANKLERIVDAVPSSDGDGVKIQRIAGRELNRWLDPFLLLDEIRSDDAADYIGGFPPHPHRGFETITYMLTGRMRHRDHMGNEGVIENGDVQWMTAGRGVIHSEMPEQEQGRLHGVQIWLNLPAAEKMKAPAYRDILSADIPELELVDNGRVRAIAGTASIDGVVINGAISGLTTEPVYLDLSLTPESSATVAVDSGHRLLAYVLSGSTGELRAGQLGIYSPGDHLSLQSGKEGARLLLLAGKPLAEPVVQYGPFVMNSPEQINQAIADYQAGRLAV